MGQHTDPGFLQLDGATGLVGGWLGAREVEEEISDAAVDLVGAMRRVDAERTQHGLDRMAAACTERGLPGPELDTSADGQAAYTCALAGDVASRDGGPADWRLAVGSTADPDPVWFEIFGMAGLLGGMRSMPHPSGHPEFDGIGGIIFTAASVPDPLKRDHYFAMLSDELHQLTTVCADE